MADNSGNAVLEKFTALNEEYKATEEQAKADLKEYNDYCDASDNDLSVKLGEIREKIAAVEELIAYSKKHSKDPEAATTAFETEMDTLLQIRGYINPDNDNDAEADTLYFKATAQKLFYEEEMERTKKKINGSKVQAKRLYDSQLAELHARKEKLSAEFHAYTSSDDFKNYLKSLSADAVAFNSSNKSELGECPAISLGQRQLKLPVPADFLDELSMSTNGKFNSAAKTIGAPYSVDIANGKVVYADFEQRNESYILGGIQRFLINVLKYYENSIESIFFGDAVHFTSDSLGHIAALARGVNSIIAPVPEDEDHLVSKLKEFKADLREDAEKLNRVLVFHSFPENYSEDAVAEVLELVENCEKYKVAIVITHNAGVQTAEDKKAAEEAVRAKAEIIRTRNGGFYIESTGDSLFWYSAPSDLPEDVRRTFIEQRRRAAAQAAPAPEVHVPTSVTVPAAEEAPAEEAAPVEEEAAPSKISYKKGSPVVKIPYGQDSLGKPLYYELSDVNGTAYICGTKKAGRGIFIRNIVDEIIKTTHPDDVELWLIDFDGNDLDCYSAPAAPHIRYLILGGADELAYSVLDRLYEVMEKREQLFRGRWDKFADVPAGEYMPQIVCVVDGFEAIAKAISADKALYTAKLRYVLENASKFGVRIILAGDSFSDNGKTPEYFEGGLIKFRAAMNSTDIRIIELFDSRYVTADDMLSVGQIPLHHALVQIPVAENGSYLKLAKVELINPAEEMKKTAESALDWLFVTDEYDPENNAGYISKKTAIKSVSGRTSFNAVCANIEKEIRNKPEDAVNLFIGSTGTLKADHPVRLHDSFGGNLLVENSVMHHRAASQVIISAARSAILQGLEVVFLADENSDILYDIEKNEYLSAARFVTEFAGICKEIAATKADIIDGNRKDKAVIMLGAEQLFSQMATFGTENLADGRKNATADTIFLLSQGAKQGVHFLVQITEGENSEELSLAKRALAHKLTVTDDFAVYSYKGAEETYTVYSNPTTQAVISEEDYLL